MAEDIPCPHCDDSGWVEFIGGGIWTGEMITSRREPCECACGQQVAAEHLKDTDHGSI